MEQYTLEFYLEKVGRITVNEAMQLALEAEDFATQVGPQDIAYRKFKNDTEHFFRYAELLEQEVSPA
jgi:hypothetical protein